MGGKSKAPAPYKPPEPVVDEKAYATPPGTSAGSIAAAADEEKKNAGANNLGSTGKKEASKRDPGSVINGGSSASLGASSVLTG